MSNVPKARELLQEIADDLRTDTPLTRREASDRIEDAIVLMHQRPYTHGKTRARSKSFTFDKRVEIIRKKQQYPEASLMQIATWCEVNIGCVSFALNHLEADGHTPYQPTREFYGLE